MMHFTRQEQTIILVLLGALLAGFGIEQYEKIKKRHQWQEKHFNEFAQFQTISASVPVDSSLSPENRSLTSNVTKKSLTGKININTATVQELQLVPHIGPVLAQNIIDYRTRNGTYKSIEEIVKVKRIGPKTFNKIKMSITIE